MFKEEGAVPTCNLSEIVHNKWLQTFGEKMIDMYHATIDDFTRAALQSLFYFNYLCGGLVGIGPSKTEHLKKMEETRSISCSILKYVKVLAPGYGVVITIYTSGSLD